MPWFRLEDSFYLHPKVMKAGNGPVGLWIRCACWSAQQLTDGKIPMQVVRSMGTRAEIAAVSKAGLWLQVGDEVIIPDYLEFNPSAADVKLKRKLELEMRRNGGRKRAENAARNADGTFANRSEK
jgi:hypothetical protein